MQRAAGTTFPVRIAPRRPGDVRAVISDVSRLRAAFDWKPAHDSLDEILRTALAWERTCAAGARGADATPPHPSWPYSPPTHSVRWWRSRRHLRGDHYDSFAQFTSSAL